MEMQIQIGNWLLMEDDHYPGRYVLFRGKRGQWVFVRYLRILVAVSQVSVAESILLGAFCLCLLSVVGAVRTQPGLIVGAGAAEQTTAATLALRRVGAEGAGMNCATLRRLLRRSDVAGQRLFQLLRGRLCRRLGDDEIDVVCVDDVERSSRVGGFNLTQLHPYHSPIAPVNLSAGR